MPHIHLEYSDNLQFDVKPVLLAIHHAMINAGYVNDANDLKSRGVCQQNYLVGLNVDAQQHAYVHAKVSLLSGRSETLKAEISDCILKVLQEQIPQQEALSLQLCVEILEMPKSSYRKSKC